MVFIPLHTGRVAEDILAIVYLWCLFHYAGGGGGGVLSISCTGACRPMPTKYMDLFY